MRFYGQAESCAKRILEAFESGSIPQAIAPIFIRRNDDIPCRKWSWSNQLITALAGFDDARGFRQWLDSGRAVRKGEKAIYILGPITKVIADTDANGQPRERVAVVGFKSIPVFGLGQTDIVDAETWAKQTELDRKAAQFIDELPLIGVARAWGLTIKAYSGRSGGALGWFKPGATVCDSACRVESWGCAMNATTTDQRVDALAVGATDPALMTIKDLSAYTRLSVRQLWKLLGSKRLPDPVRISRSVRWKKSTIDLWIQNGCKMPEAVTP